MHDEGIVAFSEETFDDEVDRLAVPLLLDFWTSWCEPCKRMAASLNELQRELRGRAVIGQVNVETHGDLANRFGIRSVPTLLVFKAGRVVEQRVGVAPKADIRALVERHMD